MDLTQEKWALPHTSQGRLYRAGMLDVVGQLCPRVPLATSIYSLSIQSSVHSALYPDCYPLTEHLQLPEEKTCLYFLLSTLSSHEDVAHRSTLSCLSRCSVSSTPSSAEHSVHGYVTHMKNFAPQFLAASRHCIHGGLGNTAVSLGNAVP